MIDAPHRHLLQCTRQRALAEIALLEAAVVKEFRNRHSHGDVPEPCTHCIDAYGLMCSKRTKYGV